MAVTSDLAARKARAGTRRRVVMGAVKGSVEGPEGAAAGAVKGLKPKPGSSVTGQTRIGGTSPPRPGAPARPAAPLPPTGLSVGRKAAGTVKQRAGRLAGRASGGVLLAEYFTGALIICLTLFTTGPAKGYTRTMANILIRLTAFTAVFFILFLAAGSPKAGKAAAWFGLLVDLGIVFTAYQASFFDSLTSLVQGAPTGVDQATLLAATSVGEPARTQLPDE